MSWRYENYGTADLLKVSGATVELPQSKYGFAYYCEHRNVAHFDLPADTKELWVKFDIYVTKQYQCSIDNRLRVYNYLEGHVTGFSSGEFDNVLWFFMNVAYPARSTDFADSIYADSVRTFILHMKSDSTTGILDLWTDGKDSPIFSRSGNINNGKPMDVFFIASNPTILIYNLII